MMVLPHLGLPFLKDKESLCLLASITLQKRVVLSGGDFAPEGHLILFGDCFDGYNQGWVDAIGI